MRTRLDTVALGAASPDLPSDVSAMPRVRGLDQSRVRLRLCERSTPLVGTKWTSFAAPRRRNPTGSADNDNPVAMLQRLRLVVCTPRKGLAALLPIPSFWERRWSLPTESAWPMAISSALHRCLFAFLPTRRDRTPPLASNLSFEGTEKACKAGGKGAYGMAEQTRGHFAQDYRASAWDPRQSTLTFGGCPW